MAQTFINVQDYVALDNVYIIEKPAMLEDMVLFQSLCKFYVLAFITIGTSSGVSSSPWKRTTNGYVAAFKETKSYGEAEKFCTDHLRAAFFPVTHLEDIAYYHFDDTVDYWVKDNSYSGMCTSLRFNGVRWNPIKDHCYTRHPFLCEEPMGNSSISSSTIASVKSSMPSSLSSVTSRTATTNYPANNAPYSMATVLNTSAFTSAFTINISVINSTLNMNTSPNTSDIQSYFTTQNLAIPLAFTRATSTTVSAIPSSVTMSTSTATSVIQHNFTMSTSPTASATPTQVTRTTSPAILGIQPSFTKTRSPTASATPSSVTRATANQSAVTRTRSTATAISSTLTRTTAPTASAIPYTLTITAAPTTSVDPSTITSLATQKPSAITPTFSMITSPNNSFTSVTSAKSSAAPSAFTVVAVPPVASSFTFSSPLTIPLTLNTASPPMIAWFPISASALPTLSSSASGNHGVVTEWFVWKNNAYALSRSMCPFVGANKCCGEISATLSTTLDKNVLKHVTSKLPKNGHDGKFWINGSTGPMETIIQSFYKSTSCFISTQHRCDVLSVVNDTYSYSTADVTEYHFSLCQRQTSRVQCKEFDRVWKPVGSTEYFISGKPRSFKKAEQQCIQLGGGVLNVSKVNEQFLDALQLRNIEGVFWVNDELGVSFTNPAMALTHCIALKVTSQLYSRITRSCTEFLYSICERQASSTATSSTATVANTAASSTTVTNNAASSTTVTNTAASSTTVTNTAAPSTSLFSTLDSSSLSTMNDGTTTQPVLKAGATTQPAWIVGTTTQPAWIKRKRHEYYVTQDHMTHKEAEKHCTDHLNSSLAFFTMATMYFKLPQMLHLYPDKYWVGDGLASKSSDSCLAMQVQDFNSSFLFSESCTSHHRSICRRPVVNDIVTFDPEFLQMLEELAEPSKKSKAKLRKLTSATDDRKSVQTMGIVGTIYIAVVTLIILAIDLSNLKGCTKRRHRRLSSLTA